MGIYFYFRKDFSFKKWLLFLNSGITFWKQVALTMFFFGIAFIFTNILENIFPYLNTGMINLRVDNGLELILFIGSTIILPPIVEEVFLGRILHLLKIKKY